MNKYFTTTTLAVTVLFILSLFPSHAFAANLFFSGPSQVTAGEAFSIDVLVQTEDRGFNAAEATITFPNDILEVTSVDTAPSSTIFNFWLHLPSFSNSTGQVIFSGGTTQGVLGPATQILSIHFRAKGSGSALISANDASVNASDGSGANILESINAFSLVVSPAPVVVPKQTVVPTEVFEPVTPLPVAEEVTPEPIVPEEITPEYFTWEDIEQGECLEVFSKCTLHFPTVTNIAIQSRGPAGANLFVEGTAPDGDHVHVLLFQKDIPYIEVTAIIQEDRHWEAVLPDIFSYDTYELATWTESADNLKQSELSIQSDVHIFPRFSFSLFGVIVPWYATVTGFLGLCVVVLVGILIRQTIFRRDREVHLKTVKVLLGISLLGLIVMLVFTYLAWRREFYPPVTYWKDTMVQCITRTHALVYPETHGSAELSVSIDGAPQLIAAGIGVSPTCIAEIHTHDETGRLHLHLHDEKHPGHNDTLADFFAVAGGTIEKDGYTVSVMINGDDYTDRVNEYVIQDGDIIVMKYTSVISEKNE